jgi:hypothetical protein
VRGQETYELVLVADPRALRKGSAVRYVYVLVVDPGGNVVVLYPADKLSLDNRLPQLVNGQIPSQIPLGRRGKFRVAPPYGADTYILLATSDPFPALDDLEQDGVRGSDRRSLGLLDALGRLRGERASTLSAWTLDRLVLTSIPPAAGKDARTKFRLSSAPARP